MKIAPLPRLSMNRIRPASRFPGATKGAGIQRAKFKSLFGSRAVVSLMMAMLAVVGPRAVPGVRAAVIIGLRITDVRP